MFQVHFCMKTTNIVLYTLRMFVNKKYLINEVFALQYTYIHHPMQFRLYVILFRDITLLGVDTFPFCNTCTYVNILNGNVTWFNQLCFI